MRGPKIPSSIALLLASIATAAGSAQPLFAGSTEVLEGAQAEAVFKQCSRPTPKPSRLLNDLSAKEIEVLEAAVERRIVAEHESSRFPPRQSTSYARQYVAYLADGHRKIYGNYFPTSLPMTPKGEAVVACDGGAQFWGVVFDPAREEVESMEFNGAV